MNDISLLENQIGYKFKNIKFLKIALTHKSYLDEFPELMSNQRYEFFGDAILDFDLTEYLFKNYPELDEGSLTKIRSSAVNQFNLVQIGKRIDIGKYLYLSKAEDSTGGRNKDSIIEDAVEALIASLYFDGGLKAVNNFVSNFIYPSIQELSENPGQKDYKTRLQEHYAKQGKKVNYEDQSSGPDHDKNFQTEVFLDNELIGSGIGKSKKASQQDAAKNALSDTNA